MKRNFTVLASCIGVFMLDIHICLASDIVKFAAIIYRHGDRTPVKPYPKDPWGNQSFWPEKFGELTNTGKNQHYAFGQSLRNLYSHLISTKFDPSEIYIQSTDVDRTLMSAQVNLAGMYPPVDGSIWNDSLMWQPIPIHTVPEDNDEVLAMKKQCAVYEKEKLKLINSKHYKKRLSKYKNLMEYLAKYTGSEIKDYVSIEYIYNTLTIESIYNFTLPNWTHAVFPDKMREPACYSFTTSTATPLMARLKVGPLLKEITSSMSDAVEGGKHRKLTIYSAHDDTVGAVLNAMGLFDGNCPVYTAAVFLELLYDNSNATHFVRIMYRNTTGSEDPHVLSIPGCGTRCPVAQFMDLYKDLITVDWDSECKIKIYMIISIIFITSLGLFVGVDLTFKFLYSNPKKYRCDFPYLR